MRHSITIAVALILVSLTACDSSSASKFENIIQIETLAVAAGNGNYVSVQYKVTNLLAEGIVRAKTVVTVFDASGKEMASKPGHYVVRGAAGGLDPGASLENTVLLKVEDNTKAVSAEFRIEYLRDRTGAKIVADDASPKDDEK